MTGLTDMQELLAAAREGDKEACERLLVENSGLVWSVCRRFFGRGVEADDLYQLGAMGFIKAIQGYDPEFGTQFSTYAVPKIAGEIRRFLRDDGAIKVSRGVKERAMSIRRARERLNQTLGREPVLSELAEETGFSVEDIAVAEQAVETPESIHRETGSEGFTLESALGVDGMEDNIVEKVALKEAIGKLPEKEQMLIYLRFYRGLTQDKTSKILGVSQVQVSRMERRAMESLRRYIV